LIDFLIASSNVIVIYPVFYFLRVLWALAGHNAS
jgi:hypothetical protein